MSAGASRHHAVQPNLAELGLLDRRKQISFLSFGTNSGWKANPSGSTVSNYEGAL